MSRAKFFSVPGESSRNVQGISAAKVKQSVRGRQQGETVVGNQSDGDTRRATPSAHGRNRQQATNNTIHVNAQSL